MSSSPPPSAKKYAFDPKDPATVKQRKLGVWDIYEERTGYTFDLSWIWKQWSEWPIISLYFTVRDNLPYLLRMTKDVGSLEECRPLFFLFALCEFILCLLPSFELVCQGKLLEIVRLAVEQRQIDHRLLVLASISTFVTANVSSWIRRFSLGVSAKLNSRIKAFYSIHLFEALGRLDVPTFDDPIVQGEIEDCQRESKRAAIAFNAISCFLRTCTTFINLVTQTFILYGIVKDQPSGLLMTVLSGVYILCYYTTAFSSWSRSWAATAQDADYIRGEGLKQLINKGEHRKEIVASGIFPFLLSLYSRTITRLLRSDQTEDAMELMDRDSEFWENGRFQLLLKVLHVLPDVVFAIQAIHQPNTIPLSVTSLQLIRSTISSLSWSFVTFKNDFRDTNKTLGSVKQLYDILKIPNRIRVVPKEKREATPGRSTVVDTDDPSLGVPFPEDTRTLSSGISIEFRNVSFKYPNSDAYVVQNLSFKIERGQLCVLVGNNGSGKSTILKLVARLYDPTEGQILLDGHDIKTLRLRDLRAAISILFQDYTIFPLSLRDNIGIGSPSHFSSFDTIQTAAELGGAATFIQKLPQAYDTYLERPVRDQFSRRYQGPPNPFGNPGEDPKRSHSKQDLSGGQKQRIALSRTFMRTATEDESVGLLVFDEPSASLDPTAEHDLFERLRKLRGNKTMIFSSHRFGNLTRHADLILYIHESQLIESGTHDQLLRREGEYKRIWMLQANAFL